MLQNHRLVQVGTGTGKWKAAQRADLFQEAQRFIDLLGFLQHSAFRFGLADTLRAGQIHQVQLGDNELVPFCTCAALQHDAEDGVRAGGLPVQLVLCHHAVALSLHTGLGDRDMHGVLCCL